MNQMTDGFGRMFLIALLLIVLIGTGIAVMIYHFVF